MMEQTQTNFEQEKKYNEILDSRELRSLILNDQLGSNNIVVTISLNLPGWNKYSESRSDFLRKYYYEILASLTSRYDLRNTFYLRDYAGEIYYLTFNQTNPFKLKKYLLDFENKVGEGSKLLDIDVYKHLTHKISRTDVGQSPRQCFLCNKDAKVCAFKKTHQIEELDAFVDLTITSPLPFSLNADYIYNDLIKKMHRGEIMGGEKLIEQNLAIEYQVSRTIIRTVLTRLTSYNIVSNRKNIGATVNVLTKETIDEVADSRTAIEMMIYRSIFKDLNDKKMAILKMMYKILNQIDLKDYDLMKLANQQYNSIIRSLSKNEFLKKLFQPVNDVFFLVNPNVNKTQNFRKEAFSEHLNLIQSFIDEDFERMVMLLQYHLDNAKQNALKLYE